MKLTMEKKVGLFFLVGLFLLGLMLELGQRWNPFHHTDKYRTYLESSTGLRVGDAVRLAGVEVGKILKIAIKDRQVEVEFEVEPSTQIKEDTVATIRLTNLLGGQFLGLSFGSADSPLLPPGSVVKSREVANIDIIIDNVSDLTKDAKAFIKDLNRNQNEVFGKVSDMLDENRGPLNGAIANLDSITAKIDRGDGSLALLLNDKTLYNNAAELTDRLNNVALKIDQGEGTLGKLVNDDILYQDAKSAIATINESMKDVRDIAGKINRGEGTMGKLVNDESLYTELRDASRNVKDIAQKINSGQGTLGKLVHDDKLYRDATTAVNKLEKATEGMQDTGPISVLGSIIGTLF
jgi:phospholipid/cholesterol/gamma-HCH transport system substrate-binding protein